jgi:serine/threonine-protein kinase RsbW
MAQTEAANEQSNVRLRLTERRKGASFLDIDVWMRSEIKAISPVVDRLMGLIEGTACVAGEEASVQLALREALNNAVVHGNDMDAGKRVHVRCRCELGRGVSIVVSDQGKGFNLNTVPNPLNVENLEADHGRGIHFIRSVMDKVSFTRGGTEVRMWKGLACSRETEVRGKS